MYIRILRGASMQKVRKVDFSCLQEALIMVDKLGMEMQRHYVLKLTLPGHYGIRTQSTYLRWQPF